LFLIIMFIAFLILGISDKKSENLKNDEMTFEYFDELNKNCENFINNNETALEYGCILLKTAFPNYFKHNKDIEFESFEINSKEYGNVWKVYTVVEDSWNKVSFGGDIYVLFRKNGQIICFDVGM
ncbi:hypothetical protein, partial [uncultured Thomasclavelia sp.]|uniref:hypothetical protein n=1 Tax=uncultured Thomasclavelia sp. TaxID=3025759 RepID=UPI00280AF737